MDYSLANLISLFKRKKRVIIHILLNDLEQKGTVIIKILSMKGIHDIFSTEESRVSDIAVISNWEEKDIKKRAEDIRILNGVKSVVYYVLLSR
jgi:hypothetical protein